MSVFAASIASNRQAPNRRRIDEPKTIDTEVEEQTDKQCENVGEFHCRPTIAHRHYRQLFCALQNKSCAFCKFFFSFRRSGNLFILNFQPYFCMSFPLFIHLLWAIKNALWLLSLVQLSSLSSLILLFFIRCSPFPFHSLSLGLFCQLRVSHWIFPDRSSFAVTVRARKCEHTEKAKPIHSSFASKTRAFCLWRNFNNNCDHSRERESTRGRIHQRLNRRRSLFRCNWKEEEMSNSIENCCFFVATVVVIAIVTEESCMTLFVDELVLRWRVQIHSRMDWNEIARTLTAFWHKRKVLIALN